MTDQGLALTYEEARNRFLAAASESKATVTSWPHPQKGPSGEDLAIDVVELGDSNAESALIIVSGTHGVEGFTGSALQTYWLNSSSDRRPPGVRVVLVHAFNPHGFAWVRRVNEDNVDLNRNFVDWSQPPPANEDYGGIAHLLVPERWDEETQQSTTAQLIEFAERDGFERFQAVVSGGQYTHPTGVFYGGNQPVWSHRWLAERAPSLAGKAQRVCILDLHTGLGPWGYGELISHEKRGDAGYDRGSAWWGEVQSMADGESVSANLSGDWLARVASFLPDREITSVALEFGTVDPITVLQALRADAHLHAHGEPTGDESTAVRAQVRQAFADDDPAWLAKLTPRFEEVTRAALSHLSEH